MKTSLFAVAVVLVACGSSEDGSTAAGSGGAASGEGGTSAAGPTGAGPGGGGSGSAGGTSAGVGGNTGVAGGGIATFGMPYAGGQFHLGPVDYAESQFHNACAPGTKYAPAVQAAEGKLLAGLWGGLPDVGGACDACIYVTTAKGKSALLRVVTYGDTTPNSIDVSPEAYALLDSGEYPREMSWKFATCASTAPMMYEFQTGANEWWTSLWVRNARVPLAKVEVMSKNHSAWTALMRGGDGTLTDGAGFGQGPFQIRSTGVDGGVIVDSFAWPANGVGGAFLTGGGNFPLGPMPVRTREPRRRRGVLRPRACNQTRRR